MKRSKFLVIIIAILAVAAGGFVVYANQQKTLGDVMKAEKFEEWLYLGRSEIENGDWDFRSGHVDQQEDIQKIAEILTETEISFQKFEWWTTTDLGIDGNAWYEVDDLSLGTWVQIVNNGEVHAGFPIHSIYQIETVYEISDTEWQECADALEEILQKYENEK